MHKIASISVDIPTSPTVTESATGVSIVGHILIDSRQRVGLRAVCLSTKTPNYCQKTHKKLCTTIEEVGPPNVTL